MGRRSIALSTVLLCALVLSSASEAAPAQTASFTYQGKLSDNGHPANGNYDLQFKLYDALTDGIQIGGRTRTGVAVTGGVFTVQLDFAAGAFSGLDRFLEIGVRPVGSPDAFITLSPRQSLTSAPNAFHSFSSDLADVATTAANANQLGGVTANQYVLTTDARMTDPRTPSSGSPSYIQNSTSLQATSNFNISGNGALGGTLSTLGAINTFAEYNIGDVRVLSIAGTSNIFAGSSAGLFNTGDNNSFVGRNSGFINMAGSNNSFFGSNTGFRNQTGQDNTFFGAFAGQNNTASDNAFFGSSAGKANSTGQGNTLVGYAAGFNNTTGSNNTLVGNGADTLTANLTNATAIGANAQVSASNTMVLGTNAVTVRVPGNLYITGSLSANLPSGDGSYIQNRSSQQSGNASFNINGNGTVGSLTASSVSAGSVSATDSLFADGPINTTSQYRIDGNVALSKNSFGDTIISSSTEFVSTANTFTAGRVIATTLTAGITDFGLGSLVRIHPPLAPGNSNLPQLCVNSDNYISYCDSSLDPQPYASETVKEQQVQIADQKKQILEQQKLLLLLQSQIDALKKLVCLSYPSAEICR